VLCSGSTPLIGLFIILYTKQAAQTVNELLEVEDTLEKRKMKLTIELLYY